MALARSQIVWKSNQKFKWKRGYQIECTWRISGIHLIRYF